jgi:subtilase family serine protease
MRGLRLLLVLSGLVATLAFAGGATARAHHVRAHHARGHAKALIRPAISDFQYLGNDGTPPSQAACNAVGRRCFNPAAMANSYDYAGLHSLGNEGQGKTIAIVDSFGSDTIRQDLGVFNTAFGLPHMCGETGPSNPSGNCSSSAAAPHFDIVCFQGCPSPTPPPPNNGTGQEAHNLWDLEVSLDVEWAHATAPLANILLVTTPTAETLGVQGFQQMMNAEQYVIDNHMADVITQSFGAAEGSFHNGTAAIKQLRQAFIDAQANHVTALASTGDNGTANPYKEPVKNPKTVPYPSVGWPASDPLVTAVGGTYLCTDAATGTTVDSVSPPVNCQSNPGQREIGWIDSGGGYSILFPKPSYQNTLPPGSTFTGTSAGAPGPNTNMRGIPDIAYQASSRTGVLVYMTEPDTTSSGTGCGGADPCSTGWYVVGGTSSGSPQWAGIVAMADQMAGRDLGFINPSLYAIAADPAKYAADYHDVTVGNNQADPSIPGYSASPGWDAVTGLGTPDVARLIPDLITATP